jgi:hypothetical protein
MTNLQEYKLSLFERCEAGDITEDERNLLLEAVSEEEVEEVSTDVEESEEIDEEDTELEEAVAEYLDTIEERFNEGTLTEEEVDILLESLAGKVKAAKKAVTKPIHKKFDSIMDKKAEPYKKSAAEKESEISSANSAIENVRKSEEAISKNRKLSAREKLEKIAEFKKASEPLENMLSDKEKELAEIRSKASAYTDQKDKSTGYKGGYLAGRAIRKGTDKVASNISSAKAALKKKVTGK